MRTTPGRRRPDVVRIGLLQRDPARLQTRRDPRLVRRYTRERAPEPRFGATAQRTGGLPAIRASPGPPLPRRACRAFRRLPRHPRRPEPVFADAQATRDAPLPAG